MISENILKLFKSNSNDPPYVIIIKDISTVEGSCGEEELILEVDEIRKTLNSIENNQTVTTRILTVVPQTDINEDGTYKNTMVGYISSSKTQKPLTEIDPVISHSVEVLNTILKKTIEIEFNKHYINLPNVIINIDKKNETLYGSYSTSFKTVKNETSGLNEYVGVTITFNNLKSKNNYPEIGVVIIGDKKNETSSS